MCVLLLTGNLFESAEGSGTCASVYHFAFGCLQRGLAASVRERSLCVRMSILFRGSLFGIVCGGGSGACVLGCVTLLPGGLLGVERVC